MQITWSPYAPATLFNAVIPTARAWLWGLAQAEPYRGLGLEAVIEIILAAVIVFCVWQQFQLRGQRALIVGQREEIDKLEAQVEILVQLQNPALTTSPNEYGALWQKLVAVRNKAKGVSR